MRTVLNRLRQRATFANVVSAAALFVALGGTSYAAVTLPDNSVGSQQLRTGAVGKREIRTGGVDTAEIRTGGVAKPEIKTGGVGAAELHTDSVRTPEIKAGAVKPDELAAGAVTAGKIAKDAVTTDELKDGSVGAADVNDATRTAFAGYRAAVNKAGAAQLGNVSSAGHTGTGTYRVDFGKDVSGCVVTAALAVVANGTGTDTPDAGRVTVAPGVTKTSISVSTFDAAGTAADEPFDVILAC
jgi:hypothetical protein